MEKYGDLANEGTRVRVTSGPHKGKEGIVKKAHQGVMKVELDGVPFPVVIREDNAQEVTPGGDKTGT